jgi:tetratricopeptide (TPR) repeat protein
MQKCWTCETTVSGDHYTCNRCEKTRAKLFESPKISKSTTLSKFVDYSIMELFFGEKDTQRYIAADISSNLENISSTLENIASIIEWGFEELSWKMGQMTEILQSIDHSLKTPDETKANEYCLMAEELKIRGLLDDSEKYFLWSLELNPLNYGTYIGLAKTYLQMNKFDEGKKLLKESLPHAIDNIEKSHTYRLLGRTFFAEGKLEKALETLELCIKISPDYAFGQYDYAKYCALTGHVEDCLNSVAIAILKEPSLMTLVEREADFRSISGIKTLLESLWLINTEIFKVAPLAVRNYYQMAKELDVVEEVLNKLSVEYMNEHGRDIEACRKQCKRARAEIEKLQLRLKNGDHDVRFMFMFQGKGNRRAPVEQMTETAKNMVLDLEKRLKKS